ncbi:hypothetical protein J2Y49_002779 [Azospirillum sp. BE72]|nr:hypothetical protein [Azospirillum sp. BE72]
MNMALVLIAGGLIAIVLVFLPSAGVAARGLGGAAT